jgi:pyruvate,orthophosphate dikinase
MGWADKVRTLKVRTNADTPKDAKVAVEFGAEGIGLTRTEHMFFEEDRIAKMRRMILSDTEKERIEALDQLLPFQKADFVGIYEAMESRPVTIRLLDPPLHEFLPNTDAEFEGLAKDMGKPVEELKNKAKALHELNPMMGHRGCRLAVSYPEIAKMQTRAILEAAIEVKKNKGYDIVPEIMIPLVCEIKELRFVKNIIDETAKEIFEKAGTTLVYHVGTMIEIPRAALTADLIAKDAEFFSFGTNDLTQYTLGIDRQNNELERFRDPYHEAILRLIQTVTENAHKHGAWVGICGELGADKSLTERFLRMGVDELSVSPASVLELRKGISEIDLSK